MCIPPENSAYADSDLFDNLKDSRLPSRESKGLISNNNIPIILSGDFNSWCGKENVVIIDFNIGDISFESPSLVSVVTKI